MVKLYSYGKINLFLNVEGIKENGYHLISSVMQSIDLHDEVSIEETKNNKIIIECSDKSIPTDSRNTCYNAAAIIKEKYKINYGINIHINKNIPSEAGLAGGSSNSAAVITGLNKMWKLNMTTFEMQQVGLKIGADVPFCLAGGTYLAEGIGEKLTKLENFLWENILIVKPSFSMSTAFVYKNISPIQYNLYSNSEIIKHINEHRYEDIPMYTANTLERVVEKIHPEINHIKNIMIKSNASCSMMTGSGSAVFGLFPDNERMNDAYNILKNKYQKVYTSKTIEKGIDFYV